MKRIFVMLFLIQFTVIYGCSISEKLDDQGGKELTKTYDISEFTDLDVSHAFEVKIIVGKDASLKITADESLHSKIIVKNENNTLILDLPNGLSNVGNLKAEINVLELKSIDASGACKFEIEGINTEKFEVDFSGACSGKFIGKVKKLEIDVSGATNVNAEYLIAEIAEVDASGASKIKVHATRSLEAEASGASNITIYGDPEKVETDVSGASNIKSK